MAVTNKYSFFHLNLVQIFNTKTIYLNLLIAIGIHGKVKLLVK